MFLALAHWSRAEGNVHEENYYPSIDARQILFGQPTMTIPSSALPPSYMPMGQAPPCHSIDAQNTDNPCSPLLYSLTPEQAQNMMVTPDNRHTIPSVYRYPYANNQFRIGNIV